LQEQGQGQDLRSAPAVQEVKQVQGDDEITVLDDERAALGARRRASAVEQARRS